MGQPAAKKNDLVQAMDNHLIQPPGTTPPIMVPHPFLGKIDGAVSSNVNIMGQPAATQGSTATNSPSHVPIGGTFVIPPRNQGQIIMGSVTVNINNKPAARNGDPAMTCNDPADLPVGKVISVGTVFIG